jgi:hypothetical protein
MFINEWGGWKWTCPHCWYIGRDATDEETKELEGKLDEIHKPSDPTT